MPTVNELMSANISNAQVNVRSWNPVAYNVLEYKLVGGGVVDDTVALQNLVDRAIEEGRKAIYFPHGEYYVTSLSNADQVVFFGDNASFVGGYAGAIYQMGDWATNEQLADITLNVKAYGAVGDGVTDDTDAIQDTVDAVSAKGGGTVIIPQGTYLIRGDDGTGADYENGGIRITSSMRISLDANTVIKIKTSSKQGYRGFNVMNTSDVYIQGGKIVGERDTHIVGVPPGEFGHGIRVLNSERIFISNIEISNCWGDGIVTAVNNTPDICRDIHITNVKCLNNRRQGCSIVSGDGVYITNSEFSNTNGTAPQAGIDLEANPGFEIVKNVVIKGCMFRANYTGVLMGYICENIVISDNFILESYNSGIEITNTTKGVTIADNIIDNDYSGTTNGIIITGASSQIKIANNIIRNILNGAGIGSFAASYDVSISGNEIYDANFGISFSTASPYNYSVIGNRFHDIIAQTIFPASGVPLLNSTLRENDFYDLSNDCIYGRMTNVQIINNRLRNVTRRGIVGDGIVSCTIQGNHLTEIGTDNKATYPSIQFSGASSDNYIANNYIRSTEPTHVAISTSFSTVTIPNVVTKNDVRYSTVFTPITLNAVDVRIDNFAVSNTLTNTIVWDPGSLVDGAGETSSGITVTGAAFGDFVIITNPYDLQGIIAVGYVSAANTVRIRLQNETGGTIDLASGTWRVRVIKNV
jgi:polygalacturonase